jgi:uncharacterized protein (TIGR02996 family)
MTDQELALIEAVRAEPEDDLVRLAYADWLAEHGQDERAELIRVQLALQTDGLNRSLLARARDIIGRRRAEWLGPLDCDWLHFRRGMVVARWESVQHFQQGSARLEDAGDPTWIVERRFSSRCNDAEVRDVVRAPGYSRLTRLHLEGSVTTAAAWAVTSSPQSANLLGLWLCFAGLGLEGGRALASSPFLARLRLLNLRWAVLSVDGLAALVNSTALPRLTNLCLSRAAREEAAIRALTAATGLPRLASLNLGDNQIGDARLRRLLGAPWVGRLRELLLPGNVIRDGGARAIAGCAALSGLRLLNLNGNQIGDAGALALLDSPHLGNLRELSLGFNTKISESVREKITRRFGRVGETSGHMADIHWSE